MQSMKRITVISFLVILSLNAFALEVDREVLPRITIGGRVISTLDVVDLDSATNEKDEINIRDSLLLLRLDKRLYNNGVAGGMIGFEENEDAVQFHQFYAFVWNQDFEFVLGRANLKNNLIEFPTPHDADLLSYTHVGNASSNTEFNQLHARQVSLDWFVDHQYQRINIWSGMRGADTGISAINGLDSYGLSYQHELPEELIYVKRLRHAGIMMDNQKVKTALGNEWISAFILGAEFNLNMNPMANWSMAIQGIVNEGIDGVTGSALNDPNNAVSNQARAPSTSLVTAWRYTSRPNLLTRWQASVALGYKDYSDVSSASQWSLVPSYIHRLGQGFDLIAEIIHTNYDDALYGGGVDNTIQVGIAFSLDARFNDNIGERGSILNLEHGYIK